MRRIRNSQGNALIQVLVAGIIGGITMMGIISMLNSSFKSQRHLASRVEIEDVMNRIGLFISNETACTTYLQNKYFNPDPALLPTQVVGDVAAEEFSIFVPDSPSSKIAEKNLQVAPQVTIVNLVVRDLARVSGNNFAGNVTVEFANETGNGPKSMTRNIAISLATVPEVVSGTTLAKIVSCNTRARATGFSNFSVFYANSSFTVPAGVDRLMVEVWGGGGGGGGGFTDNTTFCAGGGGGGAGGYARSIFSVASGTTFVVTVGAGGAGGVGTPAGPATNGSPGGSSSFGTVVTANGGGGGAAGFVGSVGVPGFGGGVSDYNYQGFTGSAGGNGGRGANSVGNGGTGGNAFAAAAHRSGYPGTAGKVIVWW